MTMRREALTNLRRSIADALHRLADRIGGPRVGIIDRTRPLTDGEIAEWCAMGERGARNVEFVTGVGAKKLTPYTRKRRALR